MTKHSKSVPIVIGMDSNAHSKALWGSSDTNARGLTLEDFVSTFNLVVLNTGSTPTFKTCRAESVIDVTLVNQEAYNLLQIKNWKVDESISFSDHRYIRFEVSCCEPERKKSRNLAKADWGQFKILLDGAATSLPEIGPDLDVCAVRLEEIIMNALEEVCPETDTRMGKPNAWWNPELGGMRSKIRRISLKAIHAHKLRRATRKYKKAIIKAKNKSWKDFTSKCESAKDISKIIKNLRDKKNDKIGLIKKPDGRFCESPQESLDTLMDTHLPDSVECGEAILPDVESNAAWLKQHVTERTVVRALDSFGPRKAPGPDGFHPIVLQNLSEKVIKYVTNLYRCCIRTGITPKVWRTMNIIFIPKPGKSDYGMPKSYRPITLSNFFLKTLERLVQWYVRDVVMTGPLKNQHAYTVGRSTDSALEKVVDLLEKAVLRKEKALVVSLDCSGAFDNIKLDSAKAALRKHKIPESIVLWYDNLLSFREVVAEVKGVKCSRRPTKGSPQGGVLSPLVWNLIMDSILSTFPRSAVHAVGYADDIILIIIGKDLEVMSSLMQNSLDAVLKWGKENGLMFNPLKTCVMAISRSTKKESWTSMIIEGTVIKPVTSLKYLGVTITSRLNWSKHITERLAKAAKTMNVAKAIIGQKWGLTPEKVFWVYTALVRPIVSYAAAVWSTGVTQTIKNKMKRLQRGVLLSMSSAMRSTPTAGMEAALGLLPLDLHIEGLALNTRVRLRVGEEGRSWDGLAVTAKAKGHVRLLDDTLGRLFSPRLRSDTLKPAQNWTVNEENSGDPDYIVYTDGSKEGERTGAGFAITKGDFVVAEKTLNLGSRSTVFQAEVKAMSEALNWIDKEKGKYNNKNILILSDSRAAIGALFADSVSSVTVKECLGELKKVKRFSNVFIGWVRGHDDNTGNELADMLAKAGNRSGLLTEMPAPLAWFKQKVKDHVEGVWRGRWEEAEDCRQTKLFIPTPSTKMLKHISKWSRDDINTLFQATTGHGLFSRHMSIWHPEMDVRCGLCLEEEETPFHIFSECPAVSLARHERISLREKINNSKRISSSGMEEDLLMWFAHLTPVVERMEEVSEALKKAPEA